MFGFLIILKSQKRYVSYVNHFNIFGFVWPFITVGTQLVYPHSLSIEIIILYYFCWLFYILGSSLINQERHKNYINITFSIRKIQVLIAILVIFNIVSNFEILSLILNTQNIFAWGALRKDNSFDDLESNIFFTLFQRSYLIYIPLGIYLYSKNQISKINLFIIIFIGIVFSALKFTRAPILNLFIVLIVSYVYIYKRKLPVFLVISSIVVVFFAFGSSVLILTEGISYKEVFDDVKLYLFGGQVAFQDFYYGKYLEYNTFDVNNFSFDFINYILKKIGLIETYPSYVRNYSNRFGISTNIYTYLDAFYYDFGVLGCLFGSFFIGLLSDFVYYLYIKGRNVIVLIFYGYICYCNCFVFANNEFIRFSVLLSALTLIIYNVIVKNNKYVI
jgi:oligosaccharide repeat unit polymerase